MVTDPPDPFEPAATVLPAGSQIYRVTTNKLDRQPNDFNPGYGAATRFAFFRSPAGMVVPVLYGASNADVAVCETLLHRKPRRGGILLPAEYRDKLMVRFMLRRDLSLASFQGKGLWKLGISAGDLTDTSSTEYDRTVRWAAAASAAGFDGCVWTSRKCNTGNAYVFFGTAVSPLDLEQDPDFAVLFAAGKGLDWLIRFGTDTGVEVRI
ncbi:RES family NAD+ phosphorylase [Micrococcaceae bacterium RIT802]|nr:RES family NAD+ phosphorylase [Micrococcaceae bacterium RIT 802]